jgi:hypothetical protein
MIHAGQATTAGGESNSVRLRDAQIVAGIYGVKRDGRPVLPPMPWPYYAGRIAEGDLKAIVAYLRSLPAIRNVVAPAGR